MTNTEKKINRIDEFDKWVCIIYYVDKPDDFQVKQFLSALNSTNLTEHVSFPTHWDNHILDFVSSSASSLHLSSTTHLFHEHG